MRIGFLVNPIAGMGGSVGLRGTDGDAYIEALRRGAKPVAPIIARRFIDALSRICTVQECKGLELIVAPKIMGEDYVDKLKELIDVYTVRYPLGNTTTRTDTLEITKLMMKEGVELLTFVGGDGTARDIASVVGCSIPLLGIPSGVKMYSGIFAVSPEAAARLVYEFYRGNAVIIDGEVADIDEEAFRRDLLRIRLYAYVKTIAYGNLLTLAKDVVMGDEEAKRAIARYFIEEIMEKDTLYLLGPGTTVKAIADELGIPKSLLGIDAILNGKLLASDLWGSKLLEIVKRYPKRKIVLTPIGGQGFLIGRGNKQLTPEVLHFFDKKDLIIVATPNKISKLRYLVIDTGDEALDERFSSYHRVITGYREETVIKILPARRFSEI